jgi:hypothetical protein
MMMHGLADFKFPFFLSFFSLSLSLSFFLIRASGKYVTLCIVRHSGDEEISSR